MRIVLSTWKFHHWIIYHPLWSITQNQKRQNGAELEWDIWKCILFLLIFRPYSLFSVCQQFHYAPQISQWDDGVIGGHERPNTLDVVRTLVISQTYWYTADTRRRVRRGRRRGDGGEGGREGWAEGGAEGEVKEGKKGIVEIKWDRKKKTKGFVGYFHLLLETIDCKCSVIYSCNISFVVHLYQIQRILLLTEVEINHVPTHPPSAYLF